MKRSLQWQYQEGKLQSVIETKEELIIKQKCQHGQHAQVVANLQDHIIFVKNVETTIKEKL